MLGNGVAGFSSLVSGCEETGNENSKPETCYFMNNAG
jgi:hypothetical protein